jgi:3'(2'), 5'-bisphosphate nucleotidase
VAGAGDRAVDEASDRDPASGPGRAGSVPDDATLAVQIAEMAGRVLLQLRSGGFADPAALRSAGDRGAQDAIAAMLGSERPDDAVLSEEAADDRRRLAADRVWIIDPLDGELRLGAVALPAEGRTYCSADPPAEPPVDASARPRMVVSRTRPPAVATDVADRLGADLVPLGSAGAKIMAVVLGRAEIYLHAGGQFEWDSAAPVAIARAAGLHTSRVDRSPLRYNQPDPRLPDLVVCRPQWADAVFGALAAAG